MSAGKARARFARVFGVDLPILGMLHLKGTGRADVVDRAIREADVLVASGIDGLVVEDYYGSPEDVEAVLERFASAAPGVPFGVNVLDDGAASFELADRYGAAFVQMDSVAGHLAPADDPDFADELAGLRERSDALLLGGVRFKYQPILSGNSLAMDLATGLERCDAIVVTGEGTGMETSIERVREFRGLMGGEFPLVVGAGLTPENGAEALAIADAAIVGTSLKDTRTAAGDVSGERVAELMGVVRAVRRTNAARVASETPARGGRARP